jgi:hypothetical protein
MTEEGGEFQLFNLISELSGFEVIAGIERAATISDDVFLQPRERT